MKDLNPIEIPRINDPKTFECLCKEIIEAIGSSEQVQFNGRPGQSQDGVDIFARNKKTRKWVGIQCKVRANALTKKDVTNELNKAKEFNPKLSVYQIYTTASRDNNIQEYIRTSFDEFKENYGFILEVYFWEDIVYLLKEECCYPVYYRFYNAFFADNKTLGHGIGKVINLDLGVGESTDSHYELMVGKIPNANPSNHYGANYYKGTYFLINFLERKMETFPIPCFPSDIEQCFSNEFDIFRISNWINSISDINDFIYSNVDTIQTYISTQKYKEFLKDNN